MNCLNMAPHLKYFCVLFCVILCVQLGLAQSTYRGNVIEYAKTGPSDVDHIIERTREYIDFLKSSTNFEIIVFPEYGLTTPYLPENLEPLSTFVPDPIDKVVPCRTDGDYAKFFIDLSCAANEHSVYVVVNLIEKASSETNTTIYYNTNVVFDQQGTIIARYRKINLCNEPMFTKGEDISMFTAFSVNFGLMTSCDLLFENPSRDLFKTNVTDIILPHAWISETPFLASLSIQDGYAKANGVNLLSAAYRNATAGMGGAGIFLANSTTSVLMISTTIGSSPNIGILEKLTNRTPEAVCKNNIEISPRGWGWGGQQPGIEEFKAITENMDLYTIRDLEIDNSESRVQVCSEETEFCCDFYVKLKEGLNSDSTSNYKVAAFYGTKYINSTGQTLGFRTCALLACVNNDVKSCGQIPPSSNTPIDTITLKTSFPHDGKSMYMPSTLKTDYKPLRNYTYCQHVEDDVIHTTMNVDDVENLWTFGIVGRVYDLDGRPEGRGSADYVRCAFGLIIMLITTQILMQ